MWGICVIFFLAVSYTVCGILVPRPGIEPTPPAVEAWIFNHWTTSEVLLCILFEMWVWIWNNSSFSKRRKASFSLALAFFALILSQAPLPWLSCAHFWDAGQCLTATYALIGGHAGFRDLKVSSSRGTHVSHQPSQWFCGTIIMRKETQGYCTGLLIVGYWEKSIGWGERRGS